MVMDPADVRYLDDRAAGWRLYRPCDRRILVQGEMRPPLVIISQEELEGASEGSLIPHDHVIETLSPQGPDQALDERIGVSRRLHHRRAVRHKRFESRIPSIRCVAGSSN